MSKNIFITGTGTDVGKTFISGLILKKLRESGKSAAYYKAAMSGNNRSSSGKIIPGDALYVKNFSQIDQPIDEMCPYIYENAVSPHLASQIEGNPAEINTIKQGFSNISVKYDFVTMEGSGGIVCPLRFDESKIFLADVIKALNLSCVIVSGSGLGTINNVVLTVEYMRAKNIPVKGIIFNRFHNENMMEADNLKMCEHLTGLKVLACVEEGCTDLNISTGELISLYE